MTIKRKTYALQSMPYAQCSVAIYYDTETGDPLEIRLYSYNTLVLQCEKGIDSISIKVHCPVNYSSTTARHVNRFTKELFGENLYHTLKGTDGYLFFNENGRFNRFVREYIEYGKCVF